MYKFTLAIFISCCFCFNLSADVENQSPALVECPEGTVAISPADTSLCQNKTGGSSSCVICNYCGNSIPIEEHEEECDDGDDDTVGGDVNGCRACKLPKCGDGIYNEFDPEENTCDYNDPEDSDCREDCTKCGDDVQDEKHGEECDGTDTSDGEYCRTDCLLYGCGNGFLEPDSPHGAETCELDDADCREPSCTKCGDGVAQVAFEECDGEDLADETDVDATCNEQCEFNPFCGDGEENQDSEECDDGNQDQSDECANNCLEIVCGNNRVDPGEQCDTQGYYYIGAAKYYCNQCKHVYVPRCGDGYQTAGEACDRGGNNGNIYDLHNLGSWYYCNTSCGWSPDARPCAFQASYRGAWSGGAVIQGEGRALGCLGSWLNTHTGGNNYDVDDVAVIQFFERMTGIAAPRCRYENRPYLQQNIPACLEPYINAYLNGRYINQSCQLVDPSHNWYYRYCGQLSFGYYASPISLAWTTNADVDSHWSVVPFALDPREEKAGQWYTWKASEDTPLLVYDPEHTGQITSAYQLFGNWTFGGKPDSLTKVSLESKSPEARVWENGFEALSMLDVDHDGFVSGKELDPIALWFDKNRNGLSDAGEVVPASVAGLVKVSTLVDETDEFTGDVYSHQGFTRKLEDGKLFQSTAVDWYGKPYSSKQAALTSLQMASTGSAEMNVKPDNQKESKVNNTKVDQKKASETTKGEGLNKHIAGLWQWHIVESKDEAPKNPGLFGFTSSPENSNKIHGVSLTEVPFAENDKEMKGVLLASTVDGAVSKQGKLISFNFTTTHKESKTKTDSVAELSADGTRLTGTSTSHLSEISGPNKKTSVSYTWEAVRVK